MSKAPSTALKRLRKERGLIKEAAHFVGVSRAAIHRWDHLYAEPTRQHRQAYADWLGITVGQLGSMIYEQSVLPNPPEPPKRGKGKGKT